MMIWQVLPKWMGWLACAFSPLLGGLALAGCGGDADNAKAPVTELRLGYFANLTHAQAVLAIHGGDLERALAPTKVDGKLFNAGPSLVEALLAGQIDIGYVGPQPALAGFARSGGEVVVIAGAAANGSVIVARADSGISGLADLKDKAIATPQLGNTQDLSARHYVTRQLGQPNADNIKPIANADQAGMMLRRQIDAAWVPEPWGQRLITEAGARLIAEEKDLWPGGEVTLTVVVTTRKFLQAQPDLVEKVLRVHRGWTGKLRTDPRGVLPALEDGLFKLNGKRLPAGVLPRAIERVRFTEEALTQTFRTYAQWSADLGFAKSVPSLDGLLDVSILRRLQKSPAAPTQSGG